jgi:hypothetical protein
LYPFRIIEAITATTTGSWVGFAHTPQGKK